MLFINNIALPEDQQSVIVNNVAAERVYYNNELVWEYAPHPTCPGYTLYGDYFLSNIIIPNKSWYEACAMTESVTVTQNAETKTVTAYTLSKNDLITLTEEQRKINENGHIWYWTATLDANNGDAWSVRKGYFDHDITLSDYRRADGGARLGFKNPFI